MDFHFPREISSFSHRKIEIPWEIGVPKLALRTRLAAIGKKPMEKIHQGDLNGTS
jgi:hypothetical protein